MKTLIIALAALAIAIPALPSSADAASRKYRKASKSHAGYHRKRRFTQREIDRLPIRITRPPNTGHYQFQDFPLWAARAFQPVLSR